MTGEARSVEVTYRGLRLAQGARLEPDGDTAGFIELETPMPVGARVTLIDEHGVAVEARVVSVVEQEAGARSPPGMRVDWRVEAQAPAPPEASSIAVSSTDLMPAEEAEEPAEPPDEPAESSTTAEPPAGGGKRKRRKKTVVGRP